MLSSHSSSNMQSPLASLLLIVILIDYNNGNSETKGVEDLTAARNITCSLYTGSNRVLYTRTWTKKTTCYFAVTLINLQRAQQSERPLDQCIFIINGVESSDSPCQRPIRGADLLSGRSHSARTDIKITCVRSAMKFRESDPSVVTVLDLMKPSISVSTEHTDTLIHCEAPSVITGAHFHLYNNRSSAHIKETQAGEQDRAVTFTVPNNSDSTLIYCCRYQYKSINSELSDCIEAVEPTGESTEAACEVPNEGASSDPTTTSDLMYITVSHLPSHPSAFQPQEESVVYSSLKTN
ncbi:hypothetical protein JZ751_009446 [Albula glossodonta]|uniref:C19orf38 Ig domain-containing protein n=1 Tax=Albula glossodonta TaxID=121402 RepID=A0A8T2NZI7_9TELE|nr:hypothetical protein JZ751_009446 [Albula glossodonta]